jgi:DNA topoisomerase-1
VIKEDREGTKRMYDVLALKNHQIRDEIKSEITGAENNKLFPTDIGSVVNDFLIEHFDQFLNYEFTAKVEMDFDEIAAGNKNWSLMIDSFYVPFHIAVNKTLKESERATGSRLLGTEPKSGKNVYVRIGRYGPLAQIGETEDEDKKFANLRNGLRLETITLEEALDLFKLPRSVGAFEEYEMVIGIGRFGPYIHHNSAFYSLGKEDDPMTITSERAVEIIENKREADAKKVIAKFDTDPIISVLNGRLGPYITQGKNNYKIPKDLDPRTLTLEICEKIIETVEAAKPRRKPTR